MRTEGSSEFLPGPPETCLGCGRPDLEAVSAGWDTNFRCRSCGRCWHYELGYVVEVDPANCIENPAETTSR